MTSNDLATNAALAIGAAADTVAARHAFADYRTRVSPQTKRRQDNDLKLFTAFLASVGITASGLSTEPDGWQYITWGLVQSFINFQLQSGYAIKSVNVQLSSIKSYSHLAFKANVLSHEQHAMINTVKGYSHGQQDNVNSTREITRIGAKKAKAVVISHILAQRLKHGHPDTPQGRRDRLLMTLLLDHGMRVGEVHLLTVSCFDFDRGLMRFYRPKIKDWSKHELTADSHAALLAYRDNGDMPSDLEAPLMRASDKTKALTFEGMTANRLSDRVREIGKRLGVAGLSAHDCRHYWATRAAENGADPFRLQEAGGWSSLAMPRRYIQVAEIANKGIDIS